MTDIISDQERPLVWTTPNPDPLAPPNWMLVVDPDLSTEWRGAALHVTRRHPEPHRPGLRFVVALLIGGAFAFGFLTRSVIAAPRSAQHVIPDAVSTPLRWIEDIAATREPAGPSGVPTGSSMPRDATQASGTPSPAPDLPPERVTSGIASYVPASYGSRYLALPDGPGIHVRICSPIACVTRTSTDSGPDRAMQRRGRVADLSFADFGRLCVCPPASLGLLRVTVERVGPSVTAPPTDAKP